MLRPKNILYNILPVTPFSVNYNRTHKSQLKYEIKYDLYKTANRNQKNCTLGFFKPKNPAIFQPRRSQDGTVDPSNPQLEGC